jgi:hypothetical protein
VHQVDIPFTKAAVITNWSARARDLRLAMNSMTGKDAPS